tara:strand:- start:541 stop:2001 length:1461 start_codon:yes stop_codon:yes gene_type:complete
VEEDLIMTQKETRKILRIGIIQGGKIVEERLLRKREPVTVGESAKNTFVIPSTGLPSRFPLFELKGDKYYLTIADWMQGRLSLGTGVADLNGLKKQGVAKKVGQVDYKDPKGGNAAKKKVPVFQVPLSEKSRGKMTFGDTTLLFQFVTPPPLPAKPQLPILVTGGWLKGVDWIFSTILLVSFLLHVGVIFMCQKIGPLPKVTLDQIPERFAKYIQPIQPVKRPPPVRRETDNGKKSDKGKKSAKRKAPKKRATKARKAPPKRRISAEESARRAQARKNRIRKQLSRVGIIALIGAKGTGSGSSVQDVISGNSIDGRLDRALEGVKGLAVAGSGANRGTRRGGGGRGSLSIKESLQGGPRGGGGGGGKTRVRRKRARIKSALKIESIEPEGGTINQGSLGRLLRRKRGLFQYCYEKELKRSPNLRGKIALRVQIALNGRVSNIEIEENNLGSNVARCISSRVRRIRFPRPKGEAVSIVIPLLFSPSS